MFAKYISGNSARLFLNTELGCASSCEYCYLPAEGYPIGASADRALRISAQELLVQLEQDGRVKKGLQGTVFSIGCFSECWDNRNRKETLGLILGLLPFGNPIQMATKRRVNKEDLYKIVKSSHWQKQLFIFISSASVSKWAVLEKGTTSPVRRFESFKNCHDVGVKSFLYIKPVLPNVTINDVNYYGEIMDVNRVSAIVGDQFEKGGEGRSSPISIGLKVKTHSDVDKIRVALSAYGKVYNNSTDVLERAHNDNQLDVQ